MAQQVSPGIVTTERSISTIVPQVATSPAAISGVFRWGPVGERVLVDSEQSLVTLRGLPTNLNPETWFCASSFLAYGNELETSRAANTLGTSPETLVTIQTANATVVIPVGTTANLAQGMTVIASSNTGLTIGATIASVVNTTAFTLSTNAAALITGNSTIQTATNTAFSAIANTGDIQNLAGQIIKSRTDFAGKSLGDFDTDANFIAKYPGAIGNSLRVSVCANSTGYKSTVNLSSFTNSGFVVAVNGNTAVFTSITGSNTTALAAGVSWLTNFAVTDQLLLGNTLIGTQYLKITSLGSVVGSNASYGNSTFGSVTVTFGLDDLYKLSANVSLLGANASGSNSITRFWEFFNAVDKAPGQSAYQIAQGNSAVNGDELHVVVVDDGGKFTGVPGTILETFERVSRSTDAKSLDGTGNYYIQIINDQSEYVWAINDISGAISNTALNLTSSTLGAKSIAFTNGNDGADESNLDFGSIAAAWDLFQSTEDVDIRYLITGKSNDITLSNYLVDNIAENRLDCVVFTSPERGHVVNNVGSENASIVSFRNNLRASSYLFIDSGYKYMSDRYNNVSRWIPLNGDMAGLTARTAQTNDAWWSPAGYNRGQIKNVLRVAFNPSQADRDLLYPADVNPVVSFPGQGTILYGDKTALGQPSAFNRINVRMLFIVLRKAISEMAKFSLFEFNDDFTRAQFRAAINPYLADIQGRRGLTDFFVVCDATNNTPVVIQNNRFIGDIYVKPNYSINFIQLNFTAVGPTVSFAEAVVTV